MDDTQAIDAGAETAVLTGEDTEAAPLVRLDGFTGSLDLLLALARRHGIDLATLSIRTLVDQLATALARTEIRLERRADWLVAAAWLALLKSQFLLPDPGEARAPPPAEALRERLLARLRMRAAADWLACRRPQLGVDVFARGRPEFFARQTGGDIVGLLRACLWLLRKPIATPPAVPRPRRLWRSPEAIAHMAAALAGLPAGGELLDFLPDEAVAAARADADPDALDAQVALHAAIATPWLPP
jgi:segregation and condensation protein A